MNEARDLNESADKLEHESKVITSSLVNYMTVVGNGISKLSSLFSTFNGAVGSFINDIGKALSGIGSFQKALGYQSQNGNGGGITGIFKDAAGIYSGGSIKA